MAKVILLCGKLCAGKTTYARQLARSGRAVFLSTDPLMARLYAGPCGEEYHAALAKTQAYLLGVAADIAAAGVDVVFEGAAWLRADRLKATAFFRARGVASEWHLIEVPAETQNARIEARNREIRAGKSDATYVDEALFRRCEENYEPPLPGEMDVIAQG